MRYRLGCAWRRQEPPPRASLPRLGGRGCVGTVFALSSYYALSVGMGGGGGVQYFGNDSYIACPRRRARDAVCHPFLLHCPRAIGVRTG